MGRNHRKHKLVLKSETLKRLASGQLAAVAGGLHARCTWEASNCGTGTDVCGWTEECMTLYCEGW